MFLPIQLYLWSNIMWRAMTGADLFKAPAKKENKE